VDKARDDKEIYKFSQTEFDDPVSRQLPSFVADDGDSELVLAF
jgi:hypothetical protein